MEKIDRLGWAAGLVVATHGLRIGVRANTDAAIDSLLPRLPPGWKEVAAPVVDVLYSAVLGGATGQAGLRRYHMLYAGAGRLSRTMEVDEWRGAFESHLQIFVAEYARRRIFVHAGVVAWQDRAILLPGRSHFGKSTLVAELVRRGAVYYSDEYAVVDNLGRIHPYARPLALRLEPNRPPTPVAVEELGGRAGSRPLRVGAVVVTRYREGIRWRPRRLSAGQGLLELLANTVSARRKPMAVMSTLRQAIGVATVPKGSCRDVSVMSWELLERPGLES